MKAEARLAEQEARLKNADRKARTRWLIEAGGLVERAGLLEPYAGSWLGPCNHRGFCRNCGD